MVGSFDQRDLERVDVAGIKMTDAIRAFGGDPQRVADDRWRGGDLLGYCEGHIEQGPVLEGRGRQVGVVSACAGQGRLRIRPPASAGTSARVPKYPRPRRL